MGNKIDIDVNDIIKKYNELKNLRKVAKFFRVSLRPIVRILNENNINRTNRRYEVSHNFFENIDSEEKAYWLGFLYADGYVRKTKSGSQLKVKLSIKDLEHLKNFKKSLKSEHKITYGVSQTTSKNGTPSYSNLCQITINSKNVVEHLEKNGCVNNKTFKIERPPIKKELIRHFLRGYYDGDGNFFFSEKTKVSVITIVSASDKFRDFLIEEISKIENIGNVHRDDDKFTVKITNILGIINFLNYLYEDSNFFLKRKKDYYEKYKKYRTTVESNYKQ